MSGLLLILNAGSSSLKFAVFDATHDGPRARLSGQVEGIGTHPHLVLRNAGGAVLKERRWPDADGNVPRDQHDALGVVLEHLDDLIARTQVAGVGHRVVHGGATFAAPMHIDDALIEALARLEPLAPLHQPHNLDGIRAARAHFAGVPQVACFDTAFHRGHDFVHDTFALPRELLDAGVRRYGFHGLSYEYVADRMRTLAPAAAAGRMIVAHLGSGASMCAIRDGRSVSSTMGFTPLDGLPMGTRPGQLDPGVLLWLMRERGLDADAQSDLLYRHSGLKGLSGISND
ncbi:MAG TPA: acetate kinase, partial [Quisquiliibacterium sp.]|nr:acetate kinase [Quisquiliibacterium sp.]